MSSNLKVNTILPSTGTAIGIGTASGNVDILGHIVGHNTPNISGINSVTASHFYGSGVNLTGVSGLGTGLASSGILKDIFYFDKTMSVSSNTTVNPPASASTAYTHFTEVKIEDGVELTIEDGDSLVIDVLGLDPT